MPAHSGDSGCFDELTWLHHCLSAIGRLEPARSTSADTQDNTVQVPPQASWVQSIVRQPVHHDTAKWKVGVSKAKLKGHGLSFFESERGASTQSPLVPLVFADQALSTATHQEKGGKVRRLKAICHPPWALPGECERPAGHQPLASEGPSKQTSSLRRPMFTIHASSCTHPPSIHADQTPVKGTGAFLERNALDVGPSTSPRCRAPVSPKFLQNPYGKEAGTPFAPVSRNVAAQCSDSLQPGRVKESVQGFEGTSLQEGPGSPPRGLPLGSSKLPPRPYFNQIASLVEEYTPALLSTLLDLDTLRGAPLPDSPSPDATMEAGWTPDLGFRQASAEKEPGRKAVQPHQSDVLHMLEDGEDWEMSDLVVW